MNCREYGWCRRSGARRHGLVGRKRRRRHLGGRAPCRIVPERYGIELNASSYCGTPQGAQALVENELRKGDATDIMEKIQDAMRTLLASAVVQCCEALEEKLVRWRKGRVASRRTRT
jgi:hypothetical protein